MRAGKLTLVSGNRRASTQENHHLVQELLRNVGRRDRELDRDLMQCGLGVQRCYKPQKISKVTFSKPAALLVVSGSKEIELASQRFVAKTGELLIVPADTEFWIAKFPDPVSGLYQVLWFRFDIETVQEFQRSYGQGLERWNLSSNLHAPVS